jgi:hypothetical protein
MCGSELLSVAAHFEELEDPRVARTRRHPLVNVVVIGICAVICGAQHFTEMEEFGKKKKAWLARFLDVTNGIPSHDTFNAVFALLKPEQFERCLLSWIMSLVEVTEGQILAIDGKTLRGSYNTGDSRAAIHMVSVWATVNHVSLGSLVVDEKSNEITAIPRLLELIDISGALVTIDAMGCQKEIARKIVRKGVITSWPSKTTNRSCTRRSVSFSMNNWRRTLPIRRAASTKRRRRDMVVWSSGTTS